MKLITQRTIIQNVAKHWHQQYGPESKEEFLSIGRQLDQLDLNAVDAATVNTVIGNRSWTTVYCDECGEIAVNAVAIAAGLDEGPTIVCIDCVDEMREHLQNGLVK